MLQLNLLGTPEIYLDTPPNLRFRTRKAQALLIYLAVTEQQWTRDALATLFWPESNDTQARKNLRDILPTLRRQIPEYFSFGDETIALNPSSKFSCDVTQFRAVMEHSLQGAETNVLVDTLALYRGEFLDGYNISKISIDFERWALQERERLQQLALMGFSTLCQHQQASCDYEAALTTNRRLLKLTPWDEAAHRQQMMLLAQSGQQAAALAHFESCRQILAEELDVEPESATTQLFEQIKAGQIKVAQIKAGKAFANQANASDNQLPQTPKPSAIPHNLPRQLTNLIGREGDIEAVQRLLGEENTALLTLVGQGGVGKTRLALAVAQKLRTNAQELFSDGIWFVPLAGIASGEYATEQIADAIATALGLSLTGIDPLSQQLIRALTQQQLLLVLDNFEHLVDEHAFLLELVQTAQRVEVLVTSRTQLQLHAEYLYPVTGLPVPAIIDAADEPANLHLADLESGSSSSKRQSDFGQHAGVQLFVSRVQQRLPEHEALGTLEPLLNDDALFAFANHESLYMAAAAYPLLTALHDPRAEPLLERAYGLLQSELAKIQDDDLRMGFMTNIPAHREIVAFWEFSRSRSLSLPKGKSGFDKLTYGGK